MGDFNNVSLKKTLPNFFQYASCPTRQGKTLDLCYGTVKDAYKSLPLPPLGQADHNCVHLLPTYKTLLRRGKVESKEVKVWTEDSTQCLQECFKCTDWDIFKDSCDTLDELTDVCCSYAAFCRDMIIPVKTVKMYPNNRPWVSRAFVCALNKKKQAFSQGDLYAQKEANTELRNFKIKKHLQN